MKTFLYSHPACLDHDTGYDHPESSERLRAVLEELKGPDFTGLEWRQAPKAEHGQLTRVHDAAYVARVFAAIPKQGRAQFDPTGTVISAASEEALLRAAGAVCAATDAVARGEARNAFCAVRPPGHHAERGRTSGFCFFNNIAIGALHAQTVHGHRRVAVVDFDVHHGNGTQDILENRPDMFFASTHQSFLFPNTGRIDDNSETVVNVPLARGFGGAEFRRLFAEKVISRLTFFAPDFLFISAGFDADRRDPIGGLRLNPDDFAWATRELMKVADKCCDGRIVSAMEGGYDPRAQATCTAAHVRALMGI
jgi:acetoin utilization deacetylase AcuC-like enzyme